MPADRDPAAAAAGLAAEHESVHFDYEREFPLRLFLLRHRGELTHLVTVLCHVHTDAMGAFAMYTDYLNQTSAKLAAQGAPPPALSPVELAAQQTGPAAVRQSEAALRHWGALLRTVPLRRFRDPAPPPAGTGRYWQLQMDSPALLAALRALSHRLGVDPGAALLGVYASATARITGNDPVVAQTVVSNRFRPGLAGIVGNVSQSGLFAAELSGATVDEAVARCAASSIKAYKNAYFDVARWKELLRRVAEERGGEVELRSFYNDRPSALRSQPVDPAAVPGPAELAAALARTGPLAWTAMPFFNERLMATFDDCPDGVSVLVLGGHRVHHPGRDDRAGPGDRGGGGGGGARPDRAGRRPGPGRAALKPARAAGRRLRCRSGCAALQVGLRCRWNAARAPDQGTLARLRRLSRGGSAFEA